MPKNLKKHKRGLLALKYAPIITAFIMWCSLVFIQLDFIQPVVRAVAGSALIPSILILLISDMLEFCYIHKALTVYSLVVDIWININKFYYLGAFVPYVRMLFIITGLILFIMVFNRICKGSKCGTIKPVSLKFLNMHLKY